MFIGLQSMNTLLSRTSVDVHEAIQILNSPSLYSHPDVTHLSNQAIFIQYCSIVDKIF